MCFPAGPAAFTAAPRAPRWLSRRTSSSVTSPRSTSVADLLRDASGVHLDAGDEAADAVLEALARRLLDDRNSGADPPDQTAQRGDPAAHVALQVTAFPVSLARERGERRGKGAMHDRQLAAQVRRALGHLEQLGESQDVDQRHLAGKPEAASQSPRRLDVRHRQLLAHCHVIATASRDGLAHHGDVDAAPLRTGADAIAQVALPRRILPRRRDADVQMALVHPADLDRDAGACSVRRTRPEPRHRPHGGSE